MGNTPGGLPYTMGDPSPDYTARQGWTLHAAATKADKSPASIFRFDPKAPGANSTAAAQNALKSSKMFKHPNVVRCLDGVETISGYCRV